MIRSFRSGLALLIAAAALALVAAPARAATSYPAGFGEKDLATPNLGALSPDSDGIVDVTWAPDGRMFIADRAGLVYVHNPGDAPDVNHVVLDVASHVNDGPGTDRGLLGIATDKNFASNGWLYLLYTYDTDSTDDVDPKVSVLTRVTVNPDDGVVGPDANHPTEATILGAKQAAQNDATYGACGQPANDNDCIPSDGKSHSIGTVLVAPDGTLFVGTGDGSDYLRTDPLTQFDDDPQTFRGKIMRIQPDGQGVPGHPFCPGDTNLDDVCTKIFAGGMRNPFRFSLLPSGGLAIGDVGQNHFEEMDLASGGQNFGWPCYEGFSQDTFVNNDGDAYSDEASCQTMYDAGSATAPALAFQHSGGGACDPAAPTGNTVVGGPVYEGDQYPPGYRGQLFFGDVEFHPNCGWVGRANISGNSLTNYQAFATNWGMGVDIKSAPDGNLAYVSLGDNAVREIVYSPVNHRPTVAPTASPTSGNAPLTVSLTAHASDPDGDPLTYDWDFGDGSPHSSSPNPKHVYKTKANSVATVTVDDGRGMSASGSVAIAVGQQAARRVKILKLRLSAAIARLLKRGVLNGFFSSPDAVKTLDVALARGHVTTSSCRWWSRRAHRLRSGACSNPRWMRATLHRKGSHYRWTLRLGGRPSRGTYTLVLQALPRSRQLSPSTKLRRTVRVR